MQAPRALELMRANAGASSDQMAQLILRNIEEEVVRALKRRAARHGVSAEAEHRAILKSTLLGRASSLSFKQALIAMPDVGADSDFLMRAHATMSPTLVAERRTT
jgi:plasmid stability protein